MLPHSWRSAASNSCRFCSCTRWSRMRLSSSFHRCSIGDKSGETGGHCRTLMLLLARNCRVIIAVCIEAVSCWKTHRPLLIMINVQYDCTQYIVHIPHSIKIARNNNRSLLFSVLPPHTIILRWKRFTSPTQALKPHSPVRRYVRVLPSLWCKENRDSTLKMTPAHWWRTQFQGIWHHCCLTSLCLGVSTWPTYSRRAQIPCSRRRFRIVWPEMGHWCVPIVTEVVLSAVLVRFRRCWMRMWMSLTAVVTRLLGALRWSRTLPEM